MLEIKKITKIYETEGFRQTALDGVSVNFRECEFASILGPSGSGKTTFLNIIGGLDHYTSGDLIINEIPSPNVNIDAPLQFQPALLDYNEYVGRIGIGLVKAGTIKENEMVSCVRLDGTIKQFRVQKLFGYLGLNKIEIKKKIWI